MKSIIIHDWMLSKGLKGIPLLIYAVIYSFVSFGQECYVSEKKFLEFLGCSRSQFYKARAALIHQRFVDFNGSIYSLVDISIDDNIEELTRIAKTPWVL